MVIHMKSVTALILAFFMLFTLAAVFSGCQGNKTGIPETTGRESISPPAISDSDGLYLVRDGKTDFTVFIPDEADDTISKAALSLRAAIAKQADNIKDFSTDFDYRYGSMQLGEDECAILIGQTCFDESKKALSEAGYGDYIIKIEGSRIIVTGWEASAVQQGVSELVRMIKSGTDDAGNIILPKEFNKTVEVNATVNLMLLDSIAGEKGALTDQGNGCSRVTVNKVTETGFSDYLISLESASYRHYASHEFDGSRYRTYLTGDHVLHLIYCAAKEELRVLVEPLRNTALPGTPEENAYTASVSSLAITVSINLKSVCDTQNGTGYNGMCYIFRLADGSFVIYDGGWDHQEMGDRIYELLRQYAPNPDRIVIAAWLITHAHSDHMGGFINFVNRYVKEDQVTVERVICNMLSSDQQSQTNLSGNVSKLTGVIAACRAQVTKAHPGQVFYLRNAKLEILYTLDLYDNSKLDEVNTSSVVSKLTLEGQSFLMLGDMSYNAQVTVMDRYPTAIRCDFVQLAHHGLNAGTDFYEAVGAKYAFWPASTLLYANVRDGLQNAYFRDFTEGDTLFVSSTYNYVIPLPYAGSGAEAIAAVS